MRRLSACQALPDLPYTALDVATRPTARRPARRAPRPTTFVGRIRAIFTPPLKPWVQYSLVATAFMVTFFSIVVVWLWVSYGRMIDARLAGEQRPVPRIFGRAFDLKPGLGLSQAQLVQRLNDVGYAERDTPKAPGEFGVSNTTVTVLPRRGEPGQPQFVRVDFARANSAVIGRLTGRDGKPVERVSLEASLLAALAAGERRRYVPLASIPRQLIDAVLTTEDRRFYDHPGVDPIGILRAFVTNVSEDRSYLVGGSTLTQQIVKNTFLTPAQTLRRKVQEQFMALVLESRFTKDQILELYLNDIVMGQRGPFAIHGIPEAARVFFGKDVRNVTLAEAATLAGIIQTPSRFSPFRNPERARERRNVVLAGMAEAGIITDAESKSAQGEPLIVASRAFDNEAPYFVDYVSSLVDEKYGGLLKRDAAVDIYTTLDVHLQRLAQEALAEGMAQVDKQLAARKKRGQAQAALIAVDPRTGEILALVGGRSYSASQYNRAILARRQPGSVFKPFVYLAAFETMAEEGRADLTPASIVVDEPTVFKDGEKDYAPGNYQDEYDGPITLRRALAHSRNVATVKVAETIGFDRVAALWKRTGVGENARGFPSIALGVFEITPLEMTEAYTLFTNAGAVRPLRAVSQIVVDGKARPPDTSTTRTVARPDVTFLVTSMMQSVLNSGTGAGARAQGFALDAAGKTGTTNDLRDAWFIGFTPELLTAVWVGFDDNQPIGLSGSQAALPMWTAFMKRALAGRPNIRFSPPEGVEFVSIDAETGQLATPSCPKVVSEAFLAGTAPTQSCEVHGGGFGSFLGRLSGLLRRVVR
jgi:penicillin-binding protein 1B